MRYKNIYNEIVIFFIFAVLSCVSVEAAEMDQKLETRINNAVEAISRLGNAAEDLESLVYSTREQTATLYKIGNPALPQIFKSIKDNNESANTRVMYIDLAALIGGPDCAEIFHDIINDPEENSKVRAAAIERWPRTGDSSADNQILRFLDADTEPVLKIAAIRAFSSIKNSASVTPLLNILEHGDYYEKACAANALGNQVDERASAPLISLVDTSNKENIAVAIQVIKALGNFNNQEASSGLVKILKDAEAPLELRCFAAKSLGRQNSDPAFLALTGSLQSKIPDILKIYIARALSSMDRVEGAAVCRGTLETTTDSYARQVLLETAAKLERQ